MEVNEIDILLIENYLDGNLNAEEITAFDKRLKSDKDFAKAFEFRKAMPNLIQNAADYKTVREEVRLEIDKYNTKKIQWNKTLIYSIAASVILLAGIFIILQFTVFNTNDSSPIMAESSDTTEQLLKMDKPIEYGDIAIGDNSILLLFPNNDEIISDAGQLMFKWKTNLTDSAQLIVIENDNIVFKKRVLLSSGLLELSELNLGSGVYSWYINDTIVMATFTVK